MTSAVDDDSGTGESGERSMRTSPLKHRDSRVEASATNNLQWFDELSKYPQR